MHPLELFRNRLIDNLLNPKLSELKDPFTLKGMNIACDRLVQAFLNQEKQKIINQLILLQRLHHYPNRIPLFLQGLYIKFQPIKEKDKFLNATQRIRAQIGQRDRIVKGFFYGGRYFANMMEMYKIVIKDF